ncbi:MAG: DUF4957 domain-containing protein [Prevotella sp.]|nr:DUF4957 domain-containing protein [Prevotella sp.]
MKQEHFMKRRGIISLAIAAVTLLSSCAVDGFDANERFTSDVTGQTLASPSADSITFTANADGSKTTIHWPVVFGAGGFLCSVYDVSDEANPVTLVEDSVIDGNTMQVSRTEDTNYELRIKTLGNTKLNNADAPEATVVAFNSFTPAWKTIPDGSDIYQWIQENPLPETTDEVAIDLEANGHYTMSDNVDFLGTRVTLRTTSKTERATITLGNAASFQTYSGLGFKNLIFDCSNCTNPLILLSATPSETIKNIVSTAKNIYFIEDAFVISNCLIDNLADEVIDNNKVSYCIKTFLVDNSVFHFNTGSDMSSATYFNMYTAGNACINDFTARKSTFYNTSDASMKYFIRYNNSGGPKATGYTTASVNMLQCTLWNIVPNSQIANYDGMKRTAQVTFTLDRNIIVNTGGQQFVRRYIGGANWSDAGVKEFSQNTYVFDGVDAWTMPSTDPTTWTGEASYDQSGTILSGDPGFKDPANGDFTVSGSSQLGAQSGDPRWLPAE